MAGIEEIGDENDMTSLGMNGVTSPVVVQAPVPPQFADDPSVEGTNEKTCSIPLLCGTNENLNNLAKASNESDSMKNDQKDSYAKDVFELPPELANPQKAPCVNVPEWFVKEGGELCLSDTANGLSIIR